MPLWRKNTLLSLSEKKFSSEKMKLDIIQKNDSDALHCTKKVTKAESLIKNTILCTLYDIEEKVWGKYCITSPRPYVGQIWWAENFYYTQGKEIDRCDNIDKCIVSITESVSKYEFNSSHTYPRVTSKTLYYNNSIYLYENGMLYPMEYANHPNIANSNNYCFSKNVCTNEKHIKIFNNKLQSILKENTDSSKLKHSGPKRVRK